MGRHVVGVSTRADRLKPTSVPLCTWNRRDSGTAVITTFRSFPAPACMNWAPYLLKFLYLVDIRQTRTSSPCGLPLKRKGREIRPVPASFRVAWGNDKHASAARFISGKIGSKRKSSSWIFFSCVLLQNNVFAEVLPHLQLTQLAMEHITTGSERSHPMTAVSFTGSP